jgi:hypothetical protein
VRNNTQVNLAVRPLGFESKSQSGVRRSLQGLRLGGVGGGTHDPWGTAYVMGQLQQAAWGLSDTSARPMLRSRSRRAPAQGHSCSRHLVVSSRPLFLTPAMSHACCVYRAVLCRVQSQVGTVVRTGADEDPIAVMTVLNTQQHKGSGFMSHIKDHMLSKCKDTAVKQQLSKVGGWVGRLVGHATHGASVCFWTSSGVARLSSSV